ncbi:MAG: hypothetical protein COU08_04740 [Candidatus Harrisonbacteria bacterium CG10_big_fil_rev_8_21_14_0_10_42_17]|uniref:RNHCP domain-containing protein n=1 Tax=Candidatus Harrisonbacteria bacterium CG10_big_fil_rev_8_21_14_0_10_42_17 TaxID=1974584 RepID=A0A2M6WGU7_9BACT|nr:MAG: hypothetical protein COU08_04740 [Candidatus Harrisonbacteria bacterium CG10_big_fil_rev_8_21_14_0_10_42_17]
MRLFRRTKESFTCSRCGAFVRGTGYTNHCPSCLWSKHVDVHPGDRANLCGGLMEPIDFDHGHGEYVLIHRCVACRFVRRYKIAHDDNFEALIALRH